jgi:hypothetical protein
MSWRYLVSSILILLVLYGCAPMTPNPTPSPPAGSTPEPSITPTSPPVTLPESPAGTSPSAQVPRITIEELLQKIQSDSDILIVDSRVDVEQQFAIGHIKGAIPVPLSQITSGQWLPPANKDQEIVFYCT